jgi:signal transduction histidine kinase
MTNLIGNAIKFTDPGGTITIETDLIMGKRSRDEDGLIKICVSDTGIGVAKEEEEIIFEKFMQGGDNLKNKPKGTGLGLAICKNIIIHYGGNIWVESAPGKGSKFYFTLPCNHGHTIQDHPETLGERSSIGEKPPLAVS